VSRRRANSTSHFQSKGGCEYPRVVDRRNHGWNTKFSVHGGWSPRISIPRKRAMTVRDLNGLPFYLKPNISDGTSKIIVVVSTTLVVVGIKVPSQCLHTYPAVSLSRFLSSKTEISDCVFHSSAVIIVLNSFVPIPLSSKHPETFRQLYASSGLPVSHLPIVQAPTTIKDLEPALDRVTFVVARRTLLDAFNSEKRCKGFEL